MPLCLATCKALVHAMHYFPYLIFALVPFLSQPLTLPTTNAKKNHSITTKKIKMKNKFNNSLNFSLWATNRVLQVMAWPIHKAASRIASLMMIPYSTMTTGRCIMHNFILHQCQFSYQKIIEKEVWMT